MGCPNATLIHDACRIPYFQMVVYSANYFQHWLTGTNRSTIQVHEYSRIRSTLYGSTQFWKLHGSDTHEQDQWRRMGCYQLYPYSRAHDLGCACRKAVVVRKGAL